MASFGERIVNYAKAQIGDPYVWGAEGPNSFDCSGLVYAAYRAAGIEVPRTTAANIGRTGTAVDLAHAVPGDVLYYDNPGATDHVGIYVGNGQMIEAPTQGQNVKLSGIRNPTSIRRLDERVAGSSGSGSGVLDWLPGSPGAAIPDDAQAQIEDALPFAGWQSDVVSIGLKIVAAGACVALAVVGAREALKDKGQ